MFFSWCRGLQFTLELSGRLAFSAFEDHLSADFDLSGETLFQRDRYESSWAPNGPVQSAPLRVFPFVRFLQGYAMAPCGFALASGLYFTSSHR
jgi:hypothetical protein